MLQRLLPTALKLVKELLASEETMGTLDNLITLQDENEVKICATYKILSLSKCLFSSNCCVSLVSDLLYRYLLPLFYVDYSYAPSLYQLLI